MQKEKYIKFSRLIKENQGIIYKIVRSYCSKEEDREDLKQEILLQVWKSFDSFQGTAKFSTWMYRVALNTAITFYKKEIKIIPTNEFSTKEFSVANEPENQQIELLYAAIQRLNDIDKALTLMYLDDLPYTEISESLGISEVNARVKINRIKQKLKTLIENEL